MVAEAVLLEHGETGIGHGEVSLLARELDGARALWLLTSGADEALELSLDAKDCVLLMKRLRLDEQLPQELCQAASEWAREPELTLLARVRCRQRGLAWSGLQTGLASRLIRGAFQKIFDQVRFLDVVNWGLEFLRPYDARMYTAAEKAAVAMDMAIQRDELERQMELAVRMTKVRETYNFETRRMLGIVEPHLHLGRRGNAVGADASGRAGHVHGAFAVHRPWCSGPRTGRGGGGFVQDFSYGVMVISQPFPRARRPWPR